MSNRHTLQGYGDPALKSETGLRDELWCPNVAFKVPPLSRHRPPFQGHPDPVPRRCAEHPGLALPSADRLAGWIQWFCCPLGHPFLQFFLFFLQGLAQVFPTFLEHSQNIAAPGVPSSLRTALTLLFIYKKKKPEVLFALWSRIFCFLWKDLTHMLWKLYFCVFLHLHVIDED